MAQPVLHRRKPSKFDANSEVSKEWTTKVISHVENLPGYTRKIDYLKEQFLSKFIGPDTAPASVRKERAIAKWLAVEERNAAKNQELMLMEEEYNILPRVTASKFFAVCQSMIADILSDRAPIEALIGQFSGGATTSRKRTESQPASKYLGRADITSAALPWFVLVMSMCPGWASYAQSIGGLVPTLVPGNKMFTVPKNTEIDRVAAKEPDLNMFLQKGVGDFIRQRLRLTGINLNDQSRNQRLAREGSITGSLATLDLSSASDSVTTALVVKMVPVAWASLLLDLRSPVTEIDGNEHSNEMISSMGNGFTFELESLLFLVLARATAYVTGVSGVISVYGDDIIVPSDLYVDLTWVLNVCGFSVNPEKSFHTGSFRESCGGHYDAGIDITPFYLRKPITHLIDLIQIANAIRRWSEDGGSVLAPWLEPLWQEIKLAIPKSLWGGSDLGSNQQLVDHTKPQLRLVSCKRGVDFSDVRGLLHWLNTSMSRLDEIVGFNLPIRSMLLSGLTGVRAHGCLLEAISTSDVTEDLTRFRIKSVRKHTECYNGASWLHECQ